MSKFFQKLIELRKNEKDLGDLISQDKQFEKSFLSYSNENGCKSFTDSIEFFEHINEYIDRGVKLGWESADIEKTALHNYKANHVDSFALIPLDISKGFLNSRNRISIKSIYGFKVLNPRKNPALMLRQLKSKIMGFKCDVNLLNHYDRKSQGLLLSSPILFKKYNGTYAKTRIEVTEEFSKVRKWMELITVFDETDKILGGNTGNSLIFEYRPQFEDVNYIYDDIFSDIRIRFTEKFIGLLRDKNLISKFNFYKSINEQSGQVENRIARSIDLFSSGFNEKESTNKFIYYITSLPSSCSLIQAA